MHHKHKIIPVARVIGAQTGHVSLEAVGVALAHGHLHCALVHRAGQHTLLLRRGSVHTEWGQAIKIDNDVLLGGREVA